MKIRNLFVCSLVNNLKYIFIYRIRQHRLKATLPRQWNTKLSPQLSQYQFCLRLIDTYLGQVTYRCVCNRYYTEHNSET